MRGMAKERPVANPLRADNVLSENAAMEVLTLNKRIRELEEQLAGFQQKTVLERESLSQGDDPVKLRFRFVLRDEEKGYNDPKYQMDVEEDIETTWNTVFCHLAPHLETGLPEGTVRNVLARFAGEHVPQRILGTHGNYRFFSARITTPSFSTIKVQFIALGLIESFREQAGKVNRMSWKLSPIGREQMYKLIAVRKKHG
jgi:hypothetical protein